MTNRLKHQALSLVTQTWYITYVLFQLRLRVQPQLRLMVQLPTSVLPGACTKLIRRQASLKPICTSYSKKSCQGLQPGPQDFTLWLTDNFPTELDFLIRLLQKAAALSILSSQAGEVLQIKGIIALRTPRGKGTPTCRKYPLFVLHAFSGLWTAMYYLFLGQSCPFRGCCTSFGMLEMNSNIRVKSIIIMSLRGLSKALVALLGYFRSESALPISISKKTFLKYVFCFCNNSLSYSSLKNHG